MFIAYVSNDTQEQDFYETLSHQSAHCHKNRAEPENLTLLHSEWPKLHRVLAILSATGLITVYPKANIEKTALSPFLLTKKYPQFSSANPFIYNSMCLPLNSDYPASHHGLGYHSHLPEQVFHQIYSEPVYEHNYHQHSPILCYCRVP